MARMSRAQSSLNESHLFSQVRHEAEEYKAADLLPALNESHLFSQVRLPLKSPQCYTGFSRDYASARSRPLIFSLQYPQI